MLGKDLFKVETNVEISDDKLKSLVWFYRPLIGINAFVIYQHLVYRNISIGYEELNKVLNELAMSIDDFEKGLDNLNKYKLLKTLKHNNEDKYIFILKEPLSTQNFIKDNLYIRDFFAKCGGEYYQQVLSNIVVLNNKHVDFSDVSKAYTGENIENWSPEDETFINIEQEERYNFETMFDVNHFLKHVSRNLLPMKYRTKENLLELASLADLYNISYEKMRTFLPKVVRSDKDIFDLNLLRNLCMNAMSEYSDNKGSYDVPVSLFMMNLQDGKELTSFDKNIIYKLNYEYKLKPAVINALLEHSLKVCDNRLLENYVYALASDLHRNDINTVEKAKQRFSIEHKAKHAGSETKKQVYDDSNNIEEDLESLENFLTNRGNNA